MAEDFNLESLSDLYALARELEATLQTTSDPEQQWRLRRMLQEIRSCIIDTENDIAKSA